MRCVVRYRFEIRQFNVGYANVQAIKCTTDNLALRREIVINSSAAVLAIAIAKSYWPVGILSNQRMRYNSDMMSGHYWRLMKEALMMFSFPVMMHYR